MSFQHLYPFTRVLDVNGDGTGSTDGAQDFSVTEGVFYIQPGTGSIYQVSRISVIIVDDRVDREDRYGDISGGVSNGVEVFASNGVDTVQINQQLPPKTNADWALYGKPIYTPFESNSNRPMMLRVDWELPTEKGAQGLILTGSLNEFLAVRLTDNFSALTRHQFSASGLADIPT